MLIFFDDMTLFQIILQNSVAGTWAVQYPEVKILN